MRAAPLLFAATLAAASLAGCSSSNNAGETPNTPGGTPTAPATGDLGSRSVFDLEVGTCYDFPSDTTSVGEVPLANCRSAHDAEVFYIYDLTDIAAFDQDTVTTEGFDGCVAAFTDYVGVDYYSDAASDLAIYGLYPSESTWSNGDREVICSVVPMSDGDKLTGSMKNARS